MTDTQWLHAVSMGLENPPAKIMPNEEPDKIRIITPIEQLARNLLSLTARVTELENDLATAQSDLRAQEKTIETLTARVEELRDDVQF